MKTVAGIPALGLGTYGRRGNKGQEAIETALEIGYRHIDAAQGYENESECGRAVAASGLPRESVFVTTKIAPENFAAGALIPSLRQSLERLQLDQVDLTLIHWPSPNEEVPLAVYVDQLAEAHGLGLARHVGVSNFTIALLDEAIARSGPIPVLTNQFELNPYLQNRVLAAHCTAKGVAVTCYRPIGKGTVNEDPTIRRIADRHGATPAQVTLAFLMAEGYVAIPASGHPARIRENFGAADLVLDDVAVAEMRTLDRGERHINPEWGPDWD
ncbi:MAG: aldo/keto reductase [Hyphomicrobiales bacterium]|nr:aldo/keto reductase [Hyphomicrobiales bacterium]